MKAARASLATLPAEHNTGGLNLLAQAEFTAHEFVAARDHAVRLVELEPGKGYPFQILGDALLELGDYEKVAGVYFPMSVDSWPQGQPGQRQRTIIAHGIANAAVGDSFFAEPRGAATPAKAMGEPPDASNTANRKPPNDKPAATKEPPVSPPKPPKGK